MHLIAGVLGRFGSLIWFLMSSIVMLSSLVLPIDKFWGPRLNRVSANRLVLHIKRLLTRSLQISGSVPGGRGESWPTSSANWAGWELCLPQIPPLGGICARLRARLTCTLQKLICALNVDCGGARKLGQPHNKLMQQLLLT